MQATSRKLLVIEDEEDVANVIKLGLEKKGFVVTVYNNPIKAVAEFEPGKYALILSDVRMPGMDGLEVCRRLLQKDVHAKVCLLSGFEFLGTKLDKDLAKLPIQVFIKKPIATSQLASIIEGVIAKDPGSHVIRR